METNSPDDIENRPEITMPFVQVQYLKFKCDNKVVGLMIALIGLLVSIWANCVIVVVCIQDNYYLRKSHNALEYLIINTAQMSHFIIAVIGLVGMHWGFKDNNRSYLLPWIVLKVLEAIMLLAGTILLATGDQRFIGLMPVGLIFLGIDAYITLCICNTYKSMGATLAPSINNISVVDLGKMESSLVPEEPPSYHSFTNQPT